MPTEPARLGADVGSSKVVWLKARDSEPVAFHAPSPTARPLLDNETLLESAEFTAFDVETTGQRPFLVLEIGAERFNLGGELSFFDTLVNCDAHINPYARRHHQISRQMLRDAPEFSDARQAFLRFSEHTILVEHSHDAFDSWLVGRGLRRPLPHLVFDTIRLARKVLDLPKGQIPGLAWLCQELDLEQRPVHTAFDDARATAGCFRELVRRGSAEFGWVKVGELARALGPRPPHPLSRDAAQAPRRHRRPSGRSGSSDAQPPAN